MTLVDVLALWLTGLSSLLDANPPDVTTTVVVDMVRMVPAECRGKTVCSDAPGGFGRAKAVPRIAAAIAQAVNEETATVLGSPKEDAALVVVFGARESSFRTCASGDRGESLGFIQLQGLRAGVACDPLAATREWLRRAREAMRTCVESPPEERLALLASGKCTLARQLSRTRVELAERIAGAL